MLNLEITAKVEKIIYKSESVLVFIMEKENKRLSGTILRNESNIMDLIKVGETYKFIGKLSIYVKEKGGSTFADNSFYINELIEMEDEEIDNEEIDNEE